MPYAVGSILIAVLHKSLNIHGQLWLVEVLSDYCVQCVLSRVASKY
jgi:hypothetical protein